MTDTTSTKNRSARRRGARQCTGMKGSPGLPGLFFTAASSSRTPPSPPRALARGRASRGVVSDVRGPFCKRDGIRHHRGVSSLARQARDPVPNLSVKNVRVAVLRASD